MRSGVIRRCGPILIAALVGIGIGGTSRARADGMVVAPRECKGSLEERSQELFEELHRYVETREAARTKLDTKATAVEVISRKEVGSYDVAVVGEKEPGRLHAWLADNGYGVYFPMRLTGLQSSKFDVNLYVLHGNWLNDRINGFGFAHRGFALNWRDYDSPESRVESAQSTFGGAGAFTASSAMSLSQR